MGKFICHSGPKTDRGQSRNVYYILLNQTNSDCNYSFLIVLAPNQSEKGNYNSDLDLFYQIQKKTQRV